MDDERAVKARLFGDDRSDPVLKQVIKNRLLRELQAPTGGDDTSHEDSELNTRPSLRALPSEPVRIARFTILRKLGHGGMGVVYAAYDEQLERKIAVKLLRNELSDDERGRTRMLREAQALARMSHPNVVQVHEVGTWRDHDYVAMEFVQGRTLERWLAEREGKPRPWKEVLAVMVQAGRGLAAAHAHELVHRDFKPGNVMVGDDGRVRVLDFGLARSTHERNVEGRPFDEVDETLETLGDDEPSPRSRGESKGEPISGSAFDKVLTATGAIMGTPAYMAPEQHLGQSATVLSDQFSFCVVLYEALFGRRPYQATTRADYAFKVTEGAFEQPGPQSGVPLWLRKAVFRGLAPYPAQRWPSMDALLAELTRERGRVFKWGMVAASFAAVLATGAVMSPSAAPVCELDRSTLEGVWDDGARASVRDAFTATKLAHAERAVELVETSLDAYADALVDARTDACEDRLVRNEQTEAQQQLRMACLDQRTRELRATVDALAGADASTVERAAELVDGLGDIGMCERVDLLEQGWLVAKDAEVAEQVGGLRDRIADAHALRLAGRVQEAQVIADEVQPLAEALDYGPVLAEALYLRGRLEQHAEDVSAARTTIRRSALLAERYGHLELASTAWIELSALERHVPAVDPRDETAHGMAEVALRRLGVSDDDLRWQDLSTALSLRLIADGNYDAALETIDASLGALRAVHTPGAVIRRLVFMQLRGDVMHERGDFEVAEQNYRQGRALAELELGSGSLACARFDFDLGVLLLDVEGKRAEAKQLLLDARAVFESLYGPSAIRVVHADLALAAHAMHNHDLDEALRLTRGAVERIPEDHDDRSWAVDALINVLVTRGEHGAALAQLDDAIDRHQREGRADHPRHAFLLMQRGVALLGLDRPAEAIVDLEAAASVMQRSLEPSHPDRLTVQMAIADAKLAMGQARDALDVFTAVRSSASANSNSRRYAAQAAWGMARALDSLGRRQESHAYARAAAEELRSEDPQDPLLPTIVAFIDG